MTVSDPPLKSTIFIDKIYRHGDAHPAHGVVMLMGVRSRLLLSLSSLETLHSGFTATCL
jgi:hypothetical protein